MKSNRLRVSVFAAAVLFFIGTLFPYAYSAVDSGLKQLRTFVDVMQYVKENYVEQTDSDKLISGAIRGVVSELDDFSQYLEPKDYKELKNDTRGDFGGVGIRLAKTDGFVTVMSPMPGTPAFKAGLMPGDRILFVDDQDLTGMELEDAVDLMRGPEGSKVKLTLSRKDDKTGEYAKQPDVTLKRQKIVPEVVYHRMLNKDVGYLYMVDFSGHSTDAVKAAMTDLQKKGMKALVLDLRFNPGGLLNGAVDIAKLFLQKDQMIVYTKGRKAEFYQEFITSQDGAYAQLPMVVLVNQGSASASEIVSGALQDNQRAQIIGQRTFGKASVQQVLPLSSGAGLRLTIAHYYTPTGKLIHRDYRNKEKADEGGIFPNVELKIDPKDEVKVFQQYNSLVYTPGKETPQMKFTVKDPVLELALLQLQKQLSAPAQTKPEASAAQPAAPLETAVKTGADVKPAVKK